MTVDDAEHDLLMWLHDKHECAHESCPVCSLTPLPPPPPVREAYRPLTVQSGWGDPNGANLHGARVVRVARAAPLCAGSAKANEARRLVSVILKIERSFGRPVSAVV